MFLESVLKILQTPKKPEKIANFVAPKQIIEDFDNFKIAQNGVDKDVILQNIEKYLNYSVDTGSGRFLNQLFGGRDEVGVAAELVAAYSNTTMATFEMAPVASLMEVKIIEDIGHKIGFKDPEGKFVSGGSYANIAAIMTARNKMNEDIKKKGIDGKRYVAFVSADAHYCFLKAANMIGIGTDNIIKIPVDDENKINCKILEEKIIEEKEKGAIPFFIGITLGTTVKGAFDDIEKAYKVAKEHKMWLHGDGAYGGPVIFSKKYKYLVNSIENLDSLAIDFHKIIGAPLVSSAIIFNDKKNMTKETFDIDSGGYIFHNHEHKEYDQGPSSLQCGRRVDALKTWLIMLNLGYDGLEKRIDHLFGLANYCHEQVKNDDDFEIIFKPKFLNICFRYLPKNLKNEDEINDFNEKLRYKILEAGFCFVNYSTINNKKFFRLVTTNHSTKYEDIDQTLHFIKKLAKDQEQLTNSI